MLTLADADREEARYRQLVQPFVRAKAIPASQDSNTAPPYAPAKIHDALIATVAAQGPHALTEDLSSVSLKSSQPTQDAATLSMECNAGESTMLVTDKSIAEMGGAPVRTADLDSNSFAALGTVSAQRELCVIPEAEASCESLPGACLSKSLNKGSARSRDTPENTTSRCAHFSYNTPSPNTSPSASPLVALSNGLDQRFGESGEYDHDVIDQTEISRASSPALSIREVSRARAGRGQRGRRIRTARTRSSSRSQGQRTPSRQNSGETNEKFELNDKAMQRTPPPPYKASKHSEDTPAELAGSYPSSIHIPITQPSQPHQRRSRVLDPTCLSPKDAPPSSLPPSLTPSRSPSPVLSFATLTSFRNEYASDAIPSCRTSAYSTPMRIDAPEPVQPVRPGPGGPERHRSSAQPMFSPAGNAVGAHPRVIRPMRSHPSIYRDMSTAVGLSLDTPFDTPLGTPLSIPTPPNTPALDSQPSLRRRRHAAYRSTAGPGTGGFVGMGGQGVVPVHVQSPTDVETDEEALLWEPPWEVFPLKVFRTKDFKVVEVKREWDDEDLLIALKKTYDGLRGFRKFLGLKDVGHLTIVRADHSFIYPQRLGTPWLSPHKNMRMCYLLDNPSHLRSQRQIMTALTKRVDLGVEFVERWKTRRLLCTAGVCCSLAYILMFAWGIHTGDWATASQMGQFQLSIFALLFVAVGWSTYQDF